MSKIINYKKGKTYKLPLLSASPVEVNCIYDTQIANDGSKILLVKTFNPNSSRASASQTLHFTKESAIQLMEIFKNELDI